MWHASVSLQNRKGLVDAADVTERYAVAALDGVGDPDREWWLYSPNLIGHLRVPITPAENLLVPFEVVIADAGETGPLRPRTPAGDVR